MTSAARTKTTPVRKLTPKATYRGVELQKPAGRPHLKLTDIKRAVRRAVAKHADALASGE
jgi:hypothetical protein